MSKHFTFIILIFHEENPEGNGNTIPRERSRIALSFAFRDHFHMMGIVFTSYLYSPHASKTQNFPELYLPVRDS